LDRTAIQCRSVGNRGRETEFIEIGRAEMDATAAVDLAIFLLATFAAALVAGLGVVPRVKFRCNIAPPMEMLATHRAGVPANAETFSRSRAAPINCEPPILQTPPGLYLRCISAHQQAAADTLAMESRSFPWNPARAHHRLTRADGPQKL
jgi:hypothetical protein